MFSYTGPMQPHRYISTSVDPSQTSIFTDEYNNDEEILPENASSKGHSFSSWSGTMKCIVFGHPFLTYNIKVTKPFLKSHDLQLGKSYWMDAKVKDILNDALDKFPNDYHINCGGPALNIARSAQAMVHTPRSLIFLGEKALDDLSTQLVHVFKESHLGFQLEENIKSKTNVMVILYCKDKWCELYYVDANSSFSTSFVDRPSISKLLSRSNILILSDLSILMTPKAAQKFSYYCSASFKILAVNLSNVDLLTRAKLNVCDILNCADILFLTKRSAKALVKIFNITNKNLICLSTLRQTSHIAVWIKSLSKKQCTVVVFNGNVAYVTDSNVTSKHKTPFKKKHPIVDHYGVHCAFVGGFIAGIGQGCPLDICIDSGFYCADIVTGQFGLTFPSNMGDLLSLWKLHMEQYLAKKASLNNGEMSAPFKKLSN